MIAVKANCQNGKVKQVTFKNVPAFAVHLNAQIEVPNLGPVTVDVAYGGMFYVIADAEPLGLQLTPDEGPDIVKISEMIRAAANAQLNVAHPVLPEFRGITISQLSGPATTPGAHRKNAVTVATGELDWDRPSTWSGVLDRSPCSTDTCAKMAVLHVKDQIGLNRPFRHEGIPGTIFTGELVGETMVGEYPAVIPTLSGQAWITGISSNVVDPDDPFPEVFTVGDIW